MPEPTSAAKDLLGKKSGIRLVRAELLKKKIKNEPSMTQDTIICSKMNTCPA
jgi:hypothetical protein